MKNSSILLAVLFIGSCFVEDVTCLMQCGQCERGNDFLVCPNSFDNDRFTLRIQNHKDVPNAALYIRCRHRSEVVDFSLVSDCDFPDIKFVLLERCPIPNITFSEVFQSFGVNPQNVIHFSLADVYTGQVKMDLEEWHLQGLTNLTKLELTGHNFQSIHPDLLADMPNLTYFQLSQNNLSTLPGSLFAYTPKLQKLFLQGNHLVTLPDELFSNLTELVNITLGQNHLTEVTPDLFMDLSSLWSLDLSINNIASLDPDTFSYLTNLRKIKLSYNKIEDLPDALFQNCSKLLDVDLSYNKLKSLPEELFTGLDGLYRIEFNRNLIQELPRNIFKGLDFLGKLKMKRNALKSLPPNIFDGLTNLEVLDLQSNILEDLPQGCFDNQKRMDILILKNNSLHEFPEEIFKNCERLEKLYLSHNKLETLHTSWFPSPVSSLIRLDLGSNNITFSSHSTGKEITIENHFPLINQVNLKVLDLSKNQITSVPQGLANNFKNLSNVNLIDNDIDYLDANDLGFQADDVVLDLRGNNIKTISIQGLDNIASYESIDIYLSENTLVCDCNLYLFLSTVQRKIFEGNENMPRIDIMDLEELSCTYVNENITHSILEVDVEKLTCEVQECADHCRCFRRPHDHMYVVDCAGQNLSGLPRLILQEPWEQNYSLTLNLMNNSISSLDSFQYPDYLTLVNLNLAYNSLSSLNESTLPMSLKTLDIHGNNFTYLTTDVLNFLNETDMTLTLGNNPWICDCDLLEMQKFLRFPGRKVIDIHTIMCQNVNETLVQIAEEDFCPIIQRPLVIVSMSVIIVFLILFGVLATVSFWKYKEEIKVWLFTHRLCLWVVTRQEYELNKKYDAFISYSDKDEGFVNTVLVPGLESGDPKYQVCLHYRDWAPGAYIQQQIYQSVEDSRRTIVILSSNFIENVWGHFEFKTAHCQALKDRHNRVIVIVLGEVPPENELDDELKLYLSTRTYLQFRDPKFWEKLRYAMPHPYDLVYKKHRKRRDTDKLELVKSNSK